ncbi:MAG TPA: adenylate/guanylate cyclase domain-containing protein [Gammaproteobacteria bacterium]|nr:adenylate/guanylate cyclase domain-containing protein [Gammaproteobacteria bacterium]
MIAVAFCLCTISLSSGRFFTCRQRMHRPESVAPLLHPLAALPVFSAHFEISGNQKATNPMARQFSPSIKSHSMLTFGFALLLATVGLLVYALPGGFDLEENVALDFLFKQRSQSPPPDNVMLVSIDKTAAQQLGLDNDPGTWPRELHARLIDRLSAAGAAVIVFDVFFSQSKTPGHDARLAQAMRQAGNVVIFARLQREKQSLEGGGEYNLERLLLPLPMFQQAAAAYAPFALPKVPIKVNQFWAFHTSAGGHPSLPTVALEHYVAQDHGALFDILARVSPQQAAVLQASLEGRFRRERIAQIRAFLKQQTVTTQAMLETLRESAGPVTDPETNRRLQALLTVYLGPERRYLNFYGPPRSIPTWSYGEVLSATTEQLAPFFKGKVVFVGFSEERQPEQKDNFYTVFSQTNGLDLSGVEIAATAFANLAAPLSTSILTSLADPFLAQQSLRLPEPAVYAAIIIGFGLLLACLGRLSSASAFVLLSLFTAGLYTLISLQLFARSAIWLPLFVPVLLQTPLALFIGLLWRYRQLNRERSRIRQAFGYYLPDHVVENLARSSQHLRALSERMFGVCMATDAAQYTRLAESLTPEALNTYMNDYYERLFKPVRVRGGIISDVVGDAMLAIWSAHQEEGSLRRRACEAALEALRVGQESAPDSDLQTRIGLHAGEIMLGNIGALDHYEYRAVGDIVNTASRIEGLNKQLGTTLLVSDAVLSGLDGFISRELGAFRMAGKQKAIVIHELLGWQEDGDQQQHYLCECFAEGLYAYQRHDWQAAMDCFQRAFEFSPGDGPSRYYLERCKLHEQKMLPLPQDGVIVMQKK